jgi:hypothetical protein
MSEEIVIILGQIKWILGIICFYLIWRDIFKDSGRDHSDKS